MAEINVKVKVKTSGGTWDQLFPETTLAQIIDATAIGRGILSESTPGVDSFMHITSLGDISWRSHATVLSDIGAAADGHPHTVDDITGLPTALAAKADLSGGKIVDSQIPSFVIGGLKFVDTIAVSTLTFDVAYINGKGILGNAFSKGKYFIVTANECILSFNNSTIVFDSPGDEGDTISPITFEIGDWIVFKEFIDPVYHFAVINNTYMKADTANYGVGRLTPNNPTYRGGLSDSLTAATLVDEKTLRDVIRDIWYKDTVDEASAALTGDLLFEY